MLTEEAHVTITDCCCGEEHRMPVRSHVMFQKVVEGLPDTIKYSLANGAAYLVPRLYIACHGMQRATDVPVLAEKYGWEKAS